MEVKKKIRKFKMTMNDQQPNKSFVQSSGQYSGNLDINLSKNL